MKWRQITTQSFEVRGATAPNASYRRRLELVLDFAVDLLVVSFWTTDCESPVNRMDGLGNY